MEFEIGRWISTHTGKYNMSSSGMGGVLSIKKYVDLNLAYSEDDLKQMIANLHGVDKNNIVITHGATEGFFLVAYYLKHNNHNYYEVNLPEYELIYKVPEMLEYKKGKNDVFFGSSPNNPLGNLMEEQKNFKARVIDETFMEFYKDLDRIKYGSSYILNTFTKVYAGDELKLGYIITPEKEDAQKIEKYKGLLTESVSTYNISIGVNILKDNDNIVKYVREIINKNHDILIKKRERLKFYKNIVPVNVPVSFMDYSGYTRLPADQVSEKLSSAGILAVPAKLFGIDGPYLRICTTKLNFEESYSKLIEALKNMEN